MGREDSGKLGEEMAFDAVAVAVAARGTLAVSPLERPIRRRAKPREILKKKRVPFSRIF